MSNKKAKSRKHKFNFEDLVERALSGKDNDALLEVGKRYFEGNGVQKNLDEALKFFKMATAAGVQDAPCYVALHMLKDYNLKMLAKAVNDERYLELKDMALKFAKASADCGSDLGYYIVGQILAAKFDSLSNYERANLPSDSAILADAKKALSYFKLSAKEGYLPALSKLAVWHVTNLANFIEGKSKLLRYYGRQNPYFGKTILQYGDYEEALSCLAYTDPNDDPDYNYALALYELRTILGNKNNIVKLLKKAIDAGNVEAMVEYAVQRIFRKDRAFDDKKAFEYLNKAASENHPFAIFMMGLVYQHGIFGKQDLDIALFYFKKAAALKEMSALYALGCCYLMGEGCEQDTKKAIEYFKQYDEQHKQYFLHILGISYERDLILDRDYDKAFKCYQEAHKLGIVEGSFCYGRCYYRGNGVKQDYQKAFKIFKEIASPYCHEAEGFLGCCYLYGHGVEQNYEMAKKVLEQAVEYGDIYAYYHLGVMYEQGLGVPKDEKKALDYIKKAAEPKYAEACERLAYNYEHGIGTAKNIPLAIENYFYAVTGDDPEPYYNLAKLLAAGYGEEEDRDMLPYILENDIHCDHEGAKALYDKLYKGKEPASKSAAKKAKAAAK